MGSKKLKTAAEAAGYAMVNPEDFAGEPKPHVVANASPSERRDDKPGNTASRWWPSFDLFGMSGKATA